MSMMTIQRGNPYSAPIEITTTAGLPYDLTGKTVFFTLKKMNDIRDDDTEALIAVTTTTVAPLTGITTLNLTDVQTLVPRVGEYKCDIRIYQVGVVKANSETFIASVVDIVTKRIV